MPPITQKGNKGITTISDPPVKKNKMQNADSTVSSPTPSTGHGFKRKRSGSLNNTSFLQGSRTKKIPRESVQELTNDVEMLEDVVTTPPPTSLLPLDSGMRLNGASSVAGAAAIAAATKALSDSEEWQKTIERIVKSVVAVRFCQVPPSRCLWTIADE